MSEELEHLKLIARYPELDRFVTKCFTNSEELFPDDKDELSIETLPSHYQL